MKNILVALVLSLFLSIPTYALWLACDGTQAWIVNFQDPEISAEPAGGCAGGIWLIEIEIYDPNDPSHIRSTYMESLINQYFVSGGIHLTQSEEYNIQTALEKEVDEVLYIDLASIDSDIRDDVALTLAN